MIEILSQIYDMFEDGASVEEVAKYFENLQSQLDIANKKLEEEQQENIDLKKQCNFGGITIVKCPECDKKINVNFCREIEEYR